MLIDGKCHCGNIAFVLDWPGAQCRLSPAKFGTIFMLSSM